MRYLFAMAVILFTILPVQAAEIRNLKAGQSGNRGFAQYDLAGKPGEKHADVTVFIEIGSERYGIDQLSLSGDLGKNVAVGVGKKIFWDILTDMPAGFEGEAIWDVEASSGKVGMPAKPVPNEQAGGSVETVIPLTAIDMSDKEKLQTLLKNVVVDPRTGKMSIRDDANSELTAAEFERDPFKFFKEVVVDSSSGLMWTRDANIADKRMDWFEALQWVRDLKFAGYDDWRLPTAKELEAFAKLGGENPGEYFEGIGFRNMQSKGSSWYWTSTSYQFFGGNVKQYERVYIVDMKKGYLQNDLAVDSAYKIWPVRSGK